MCGYFGWKWTTYAHLLMAQRHHDDRSKELNQTITPLTVWWDTKRPQMVSQALWLKWPHHLLADGAQRGHNGEPGLVVEMTPPLTYWWDTKRPQLVSQALWLKWPHHLHTDGAQRGHKWWASLYEPNKYLNIPGDCHLWTGDWWSVQVDLTI